MWTTILTTALTLIQSIAPNAVPAVIVKIIDQLEALAPVVIQEAKDLYPTFKNVIDTLRGNVTTPTDQMDRLDAIEAQIDADYNTAIQVAQAEDAAASPAKE